MGDISGSIWEGGEPTADEFRLLDLHGRFTDDTVLACAVMQACLNGRPYPEILREWFNRYPQMDYGSRFRMWAATGSEEQGTSPGNGAAMRAAPIGMAGAALGWTPDEVMKQARLASRCSHNEDSAIGGAQAIALSVHGFLLGRTIAEVSALVADRTDYFPLVPGPHKDSQLAVHTVPTALWAAMTAKSLEDAVTRAVLSGGDTDTIGAMAGAVAEARFGMPAETRALIHPRLTAPMQDVLSRFYERFYRPRPVALHPPSTFRRSIWSTLLGRRQESPRRAGA